MKEGISPEFLRQLLRYEPKTGKLFWRERTPDMFEKEGNAGAAGVCKCWNVRFAHKEAFTTKDNRGYLNGVIFNRRLKAHRVAYAMHHGKWPKNQVDHMDGDRTNNKILNLRDATNQENARNMTKSSRNTSGTIGVTWHKHSRLWHAKIRANGKNVSLGYFRNLSDAAAARKVAERKYGYAPTHGRDPS